MPKLNFTKACLLLTTILFLTSCSPIGPAVLALIPALSKKKSEKEPPPALVPPGQASNPSPSHSASSVPVTTNLSWDAAANADSYEIYFGTDPVEVANADTSSAEYQGSQTATFFDPSPAGVLDYDITCYWRVDSVNAVGTTRGDLWGFATESTPVSAPDIVQNPTPADSATSTATDQALTWDAAAGATSYDVYFGTSATSVANATTASAEFTGNQTALSYDPGGVSYSTTYYWRIDSRNSVGPTKGDLWPFTTRPPPPVADFTADVTSGDVPLTVSFTDVSTGTVTVWSWDFGDGGTSTTQNPSHEYVNTGVFTVSLTVTGPGGSDSITKTDYITVTSLVRTWGGAGYDRIDSLAVDSSDNIYCAGYTGSFGAGGWDALLLKYDGAGTLQWARTWGGAGYDEIDSLAVDSSGNIYCAGYTDSFGAGGWDALLLKYDGAGTLQWARTWGGAGSDWIYPLAVDSGGDIYCAGYTQSLGASGDDALLLKYDSAGTLQWVRTWGGVNYDSICSLAVDSSGNTYCAGWTRSFGASRWDAMLLKYDSAGTLQWARTWGGEFEDRIDSLAVDSGGNIYCAGNTESFGAGSRDALLLRYDGAGTLQWARTWGGASNDWIYSLAVDSGGNIYCAGYTGSFGAGGEDALLLRYDGAGTLQWARAWGGASSDFIYSLAVDSGGDVYLGGQTRSYTGTWQIITTGTESSPSGTQSTPSGSEGTPAGTESSPTGTEGSPTGSETGAGSYDTLLLRNW